MNDEKLILYYYDDGLDEHARREVEAAIETDAAIAARYDALCRELNGLAADDRAPVPGHTAQRWHQAIRDAAGGQRTVSAPHARRLSPVSFAWGAALAAALVLVVTLSPRGVDPIVEPAANPSLAFSRGVQVHFRDTQHRLATLALDSATDRTALVAHIVGQNRLFERAAEQNDARDVARVLRAFEPVLLRLADDNISPAEAEALRAQLAFELNVVLTKLSRSSSNGTVTGNPGIRT